MSSFYDDASLVVIPSGYKTSKIYAEKPTDGSGDLTFTRASGATRVGPNGLIEEVRTNFARQSQSFATASAWATTNGTLTNNAGTAPDGTNTASKLVATNTDPFAYQSITLTGPVVASCYFKGVGSSIGKTSELRIGAAVTTFTLTANWQRISVTSTVAGAANYGVEAPNLSVVVGDEVLLWGFQVEYGDIATAYIPTTTAAVSVGPVSNVPRLDYLGSSCPRLLLEPQRTNVWTFSEDLNSLSLKVNVTVSINSTTSPDGNTTADKLAETSATGNHFVYGAKFNVTSGTTYTLSFFAKQGERRYLVFQGDGQTGLLGNASVYDLQAGTIHFNANTTNTITPYGNGWYRITVTATASGNGTVYPFFAINQSAANSLQSYAGTAGNGFFLYGFQGEAGAYATSYIPTLGASVTRVADAASKTGISSLIGQTEGTLFAEIYPEEFVNGSYMGISDGANIANRIIFGFEAGSANSGFFQVYGASGLTGSGLYTRGQRMKVAIGYKSGSSALYVNGNLVDAVTSTFTTTLTKFGFDSYAGTQNFVGRCSQALLFKTRLTNAQLAELTTL